MLAAVVEGFSSEEDQTSVRYDIYQHLYIFLDLYLLTNILYQSLEWSQNINLQCSVERYLIYIRLILILKYI